MARPTLSAEKLAPDARTLIERFHSDVIDEVAQAVGRDHVVLVGMAQNPFVKKARTALDAAGVRFTYLEYGSYLSQWKRRLAIKLWSGYPTFPQIFVDGTLIGGFNDLKALIESGKLKALSEHGPLCPLRSGPECAFSRSLDSRLATLDDVLAAIAQIEDALATVQWALDLLSARGDTDQAFVLARLQYAASLRASWPTNLIPLANALAALATEEKVKLSTVERARLEQTAKTLKRLCS